MKVGIIGLGLIGGSIARKLLLSSGYAVYGFDSLPGACSLAENEGVEILSEEEMAEVCDLVVVATNVNSVAEELEKMLLFGAEAIVDIASIKQPVIESLSHLPDDLLSSYVATHPMAGSQRSGFRNSRADLLDGCTWAVSGQPRLDAFLRFARMASLFDASLVPIRADEHDRSVAKSSHLIQLLHTVIAADLSNDDKLTLLLSGPALLDTTRLAESPFEGFWEDIFAANEEYIKEAKDSLLQELARDDNMKDLWRHGSLGRERLLDLRWEEKKWREYSLPLASWWDGLLSLGREGVAIKNPKKEDYLLLFQRSF
jgi:prephenate dehydrogenase